MKNVRRTFIVAIIAAFFLITGVNIQALGASPLRVVSSSPNAYSSTINIDGKIKILFNRNVKNGSNFSNITLRDLNNLNIPITCKIEGQTLNISPNEALSYGSYYIVSVPYNAVVDDAGNNLNEEFTLVFVTIGDYIPPRILSVEPKNNATDIDINKSISIKFTEKIKAGSKIEDISLKYGNNYSVPVNIGINGDTLTIKPLQELQYNTMYYVFLPYNSVVDLSGNSNNYLYPMFFTTKKSEGELKVIDTTPSKDAKYISINNPISIFYNENIVGDTGLSSITVKDKSGNIPIITSVNNSVLSIRPKNTLNFAYNTIYTVNIPAGAVKGVSGAAAKAACTFNFTTENQSQSPKINQASPQNGVTNAAVNSTIKVTFSENIQQGVSIFDIKLKDEKGNVILTDLSIYNNVLNIRPKTDLEYNTSYTYTIPYGAIVNVSNTPLKQDYEFKFKTDIERFNPYILKSYPINGTLNSTVDGGVTIVFNEEIKKGKNFDYISIRDVNYNEVPIQKEISDKTIKITPVKNLNFAYNTKYIVTIPYGSVMDIWENPFISSSQINFTTGFERFSPIIKMVNIEDGTSDAKIDGSIEITYNDKMLKGDNFDSILFKDSKNNNIKCTIDIENDKIIIKPVSKLDNNTSYSLLLPVGGVKDYWDGVQMSDFSLKFKTEKEKMPPAVTSITPVNGSKNIDINSAITIGFSEDIISGKLFKKISLANGNMRNIPYTAEIVNNKLTIKPVKPLEELTSYTLRIPLDSVMDNSENQLKEDVILNFTTKSGVASKNALTVNDIKLNVDYSAVTVVFNKDVVYGSSINRVLLKDQNGRTVVLKFALKGNTLTLTPGTKLIPGNRYTLIIPAAAVRDKQGKNMLNQYGYSFIIK